MVPKAISIGALGPDRGAPPSEATLIIKSGPPPIPINHYTMMKRPRTGYCMCVCVCVCTDGRALKRVEGGAGISQLETDVLASFKRPPQPRPAPPNTNRHRRRYTARQLEQQIQQNTVCIQYYQQIRPPDRLPGD